MTTLVNTFNFCVAIIVEKDFVVLETLLAHDGSANLAETYTVAPALAMKTEGYWLLANIFSTSKAEL